MKTIAAILFNILLMNGLKTYAGAALMALTAAWNAYGGQFATALWQLALSLIAAGLRHALSKLGQATVGRPV